MNVKFHKRITRAMAKQLTTLAWSYNERLGHGLGNNETFVLFYDNNDTFVGATKLEFMIHKVMDGQILLGIYIWKFEVVPNRRGEGFGKQMFEWIVNNYKPYRIELQHMEKHSDNGSSYRWWRSLGFKHMKHSESMMEKIITK